MKKRSEQLKRSMAKVQKGGVIVEVRSLEQAKIAESAGAVAIRVKENKLESPINIDLIESILNEVSIPVIGKVRVGHLVEARILEEIGINFIEESESLVAVDPQFPILKSKFNTPFICGYNHLSDVVRRLAEGSVMIRTTEGSISNAVQCLRGLKGQIQRIVGIDEYELFAEACHMGATLDILQEIKRYGRLPVAHFASGGIQSPADAALMMELGADGVFIDGETIFHTTDPKGQIQRFVEVTAFYQDYQLIKRLSKEFYEEMNKPEQPAEELLVNEVPIGVEL